MDREASTKAKPTSSLSSDGIIMGRCVSYLTTAETTPMCICPSPAVFPAPNFYPIPANSRALCDMVFLHILSIFRPAQFDSSSPKVISTSGCVRCAGATTG